MKLDDEMSSNRLKNQIVVITGGAGLLGQEHASAILSEGGVAVLLDIDFKTLTDASSKLVETYGPRIHLFECDITSESKVNLVAAKIFEKIGIPSGLVNNAAINPSVEKNTATFTRLETINYEEWRSHLDVGLYGAFLCAKVFGQAMVQNNISGSIVNISSDHGVMAPNQGLYRIEGRPENEQPVKPVMYSVVKHGLIGLTRYLSTYWANHGIRANSLCPGGVLNGQPEEFLERFNKLVPLGRPANPDEYHGALIFLLSNESTYMTGGTLVVDGGRSVW